MLEGLFIRCTAVGLVHDRLIGMQAEGRQRRQDTLRRSGDLAWWVDILHPQKPLPAGMPRAKPTAHRGYQGTEMQMSGRRGGKTSAITHRHDFRRSRPDVRNAF